MQTYLSQLLYDLAAAVKNPPAAHYYDAPPHIEDDRQLSELAMVPYRTIEQLSGIKQEMFPLLTDLNADQCQEVNKTTLLEYGYAVLGCVEWNYLSAKRLIGLTMFAINVGKAGACGSQAVQQINLGNLAAGCNLIARTPSGAPNWSSAGGQYVQGLQNRRQAERALCLEEA